MECLDRLINNSQHGQGEGGLWVSVKLFSSYSALKSKQSRCGKLLTKLKHLLVSGW
jgi:hypothetical protein